MKNSKLIIGLTFTVLLFLLSSCEGGAFLSSAEKIIGTWEFEQVKHREAGTLGKDDVTDEFKHITLKFSDDYSIEFINNDTDVITGGTWDIKVEDECADVLNVMLGHYEGAVFESWEWELSRVSVNTLKGTERKDGGVYHYQLAKISDATD